MSCFHKIIIAILRIIYYFVLQCSYLIIKKLIATERSHNLMKKRKFSCFVSLILAVALLAFTNPVQSQAASFNPLQLQFFTSGQTITMPCENTKIKVRLIKKQVQGALFYGSNGYHTQLVTVSYTVTLPKGFYPVSTKTNTSKNYNLLSDSSYKYDPAYFMRHGVYELNGKSAYYYYPAKNKTARWTHNLKYYYNSKGKPTSLKSYTVTTQITKNPNTHYLIGAVTANKYYKSFGKMPKQYRSNNLSPWFNANKKYTCFVYV